MTNGGGTLYCRSALPHGRCTVRLFMKSVLLLFAIVGLCLCAAQATTPVPTLGASKIRQGRLFPGGGATTLPTVAGLVRGYLVLRRPEGRNTISQHPRSARRRHVPRRPPQPRRRRQPRPDPRRCRRPLRSRRRGPLERRVSIPVRPNRDLTLTVPTPWPYATTYDYYPTEYRTPDIDPGMTPYSGPTLLETAEPTPTWETPANVASATPTEPFDGDTVLITAEAARVPDVRDPARCVRGRADSEPDRDRGAASEFRTSGRRRLVVPAALDELSALRLSRDLGRGRPCAGRARTSVPGPPARPSSPRSDSAPPHPVPRRSPVRSPERPSPRWNSRFWSPGLQASSRSRCMSSGLGRNLLRFEHEAQVGAQDRSIRLGHLIIFSAIPSAPVPTPATAWARAHGFRILAVDGSGMALVMPALSNGSHSVLGVLPVDEMVEGRVRSRCRSSPRRADRGYRLRRSHGNGRLLAGDVPRSGPGARPA